MAKGQQSRDGDTPDGRRCEIMGIPTRRKDMPTTKNALNQIIADVGNKMNQTLNGAFLDTMEKYDSLPKATAIVCTLSTKQMNAMLETLDGLTSMNGAMDADARQSRNADNIGDVIGRINDFASGNVWVLDTDGETVHVVETKATRKAKAKAQKEHDAKVAIFMANRIADAKELGLDLSTFGDNL